MASCKGCVHAEVCSKKNLHVVVGMNIIPRFKYKRIEQECKHFKDRSRFVELPYPIKPHDKVWYILEGLGEFDLKDYDISSGDCAVGNVPDTVIDVGIHGFWVNQLSERNEDYLVPDDCDFISWGEIGKTYFLTRESAEQSLKERETT